MGDYKMTPYIWGIKGLDKLYPDALYEGAVIVVAGHPGSGKTTLAATLCYKNALLEGNKCMYVTFQESKKKFYRIMRKLGINLDKMEAHGLFRFIKMPVTQDVAGLIDELNNEIIGWNPDIIVIDSVNAVLSTVKEENKRDLLQNYFYTLSDTLNGLVVLVAEIPIGEERIELDSIEFVADTVIILKHAIEIGLLTRIMEIRKARGARITIAEIPFTITHDEGIKAWTPPILTEIGEPGEPLKPPCRVFEEALGSSLRRGQVVYIETPPELRHMDMPPLYLGLIARNRLRIHSISYKYSPRMQKCILRDTLENMGIKVDESIKVLEDYLTFDALNPFSMGTNELAAEELAKVEKVNADLVDFHGVELPFLARRDMRSYIAGLYNQLNLLKRKNKLIIRRGSYINEDLSRLFSTLADTVIKIVPNREGQYYKMYIHVQGRKPAVLYKEEIDSCIKEVKYYLEEMMKRENPLSKT